MARLADVLFDIDVGHAEGLARHLLRAGDGLFQVGLAGGHLHADAALRRRRV